jgi:hypothetical protein
VHLKRINGGYYAYESERRGGRFTSRSWGRADDSLVGEMIALAEECRRDRERERIEARPAQARAVAPLMEVRRIVGAYGREVDAAVARVMELLGYHRHRRGPWRKRRGLDVGEKTTTVARTEIGELIHLAHKGDALALEKLPAALVKAASRSGGDVETETMTMMVDVLPAPMEPAQARVELMRLELAPPGSSPIVRLMASRVVADWVHVQCWEKYLAGAWSGKIKANEGQANRWEKSFNAAVRRYQQGLVALARIKRLDLPIIVGQINVAEAGSHQLNQAAVTAG